MVKAGKFKIVNTVLLFVVLTMTHFIPVFAKSSQALKLDQVLASNRANPLLRQHFRNRILEASVTYDRFGRRVYSIVGNLESRTSGMIDRFTVELFRDFNKMKAEQLKIEQTIFDLGSLPEASERTLNSYRQSFRQIEKISGSLHRRLSMIFLGIGRKKDYKPEVSGLSLQNNLRSEVDFLGSQIRSIEKRILDYFAYSTKTVSLNELEGDSLMIDLYEVKQLSRAVSRSLKDLKRS